MPNVDIVNSLTRAVVAPKSQTNNTGGFIADLSNYQGVVAVTLAIGTKTAGDSDGAITLRLMSSATNNISNATNYTPGIGSTNVATTNNTQANGTLAVDTRSTLAGRYLFYGVALTGTNSPAYPISGVASGFKKVQP